MIQQDLLAGPYELFNKKSQRRATICINADMDVSIRVFQGSIVIQTELITVSDFNHAMEKVSALIEKYNKEGFFQKEQTPLKSLPAKLEPKQIPSVLGKRDCSISVESEQSQKRQKGNQSDQKILSDQKQITEPSKAAAKNEEEKKEEVKIEPTRRSGRHAGTTKNYNIDKILESAYGDQGGLEAGGKAMSLMLAQTYDPAKNDPTGWLMSEKLDGVRCFWNGKSMYTRNQNIFYPPDWFVAELPTDICLDGELWTSRGDFQKIVSIVRRQDQNEEWHTIKYMIFDAPKEKGPFTKRLKIVSDAIEKLGSKHVEVLKHQTCKGVEHLSEEMDRITVAGGEGVMLRDPKSAYENRRSDKLLKVKKFDDAEATVIGHEKGSGRCENMLGALCMRSDDGIEFKIGSGFNDKQRMKPPKKGARVTYKYMGKSNSGKPRFPIFLREHPGM